MVAPDSERRRLRRSIRRRRRRLTRHEQTRAARALFRLLRRHRLFRNSRKIAFYLAADGEIDPRLLMEYARKQGKHIYLPALRREGPNRLMFVRYRPGDRLHRGPLGLRQPAINLLKTTPAHALNLVFVPLVAFDRHGNRLGMGKGFYDRTFAFKVKKGRNRPKLVGLAHECQRVEQLRHAPWDVPLDAIATSERIYYPDFSAGALGGTPSKQPALGDCADQDAGAEHDQHYQ